MSGLEAAPPAVGVLFQCLLLPWQAGISPQSPALGTGPAIPLQQLRKALLAWQGAGVVPATLRAPWKQWQPVSIEV